LYEDSWTNTEIAVQQIDIKRKYEIPKGFPTPLGSLLTHAARADLLESQFSG